jgi:hypothetical protein
MAKTSYTEMITCGNEFTRRIEAFFVGANVLINKKIISEDPMDTIYYTTAEVAKEEVEKVKRIHLYGYSDHNKSKSLCIIVSDFFGTSYSYEATWGELYNIMGKEKADALWDAYSFAK